MRSKLAEPRQHVTATAPPLVHGPFHRNEEIGNALNLIENHGLRPPEELVRSPFGLGADVQVVQ